MIDLVFVTYNRLHYTRLALGSVLADPTEEFCLTIWDNASTDGTVEYLKNEVRDARIKNIIFSKTNIGQSAAANKVWSESKADLLGKLDNDCILTPGWTRILAQAHRDIPRLGVVACWHFMPEDFDYERARHKIQQFGPHRILRHPWTCGTGLLLKRRVFQEIGPLRGKATTDYWIKMALSGYVNGFYYPLVYQEHMDDPRSPHSRLMSFEEASKYSYGRQSKAFVDVEGYNRWNQKILNVVLSGSYDPRDYLDGKPLFQRIFGRAVRLMRWSSSA